MEQTPAPETASTLETMDSKELRLLLEVSRIFNSSLDLVTVLNSVMDQVIDVMKAERGCIMLPDEKGELRLVVARGLDRTSIEAEDFAMSRNMVNQVASTGKSLISSNAMADPRFNAFGSISMHSIRSTLAVPMFSKGGVLGLIYVDNRIKSGVFKQKNVDLLEAIAAQAAIALENARLYEMKKQIILVLSNAIEAKDAYTRGHIERVATYSLAIGHELGLTRDELGDLEICSFLHDAGKIGVPDEVLNKPGRLDDDERRRMEVHPALGESLVEPVDIPARVKAGIRQHQERYDGKGYPDGLAGDEIHLFARIIAVADTWDAMTSNRPYRDALDREVALAEMRRSAGGQLDPAVVDAFLAILGRGDEMRYAVAVARPFGEASPSA